MDNIISLINEICVRSFSAGLAAGAITTFLICRHALRAYNRRAAAKFTNTLSAIDQQLKKGKTIDADIEAEIAVNKKSLNKLTHMPADKPYSK